MNWLEKHINIFFKINGILMILVVVFGIWAVLWTFGVPKNSPFTWTTYQWHTINFLWKPTLIYSIIYFLLAILCFMKKYFVFPIITLFLIPSICSSGGAIINITEIITYGFIYPLANILGILGVIVFILNIFGTILWIRKIRGKNMLVNG